MTSSNIWQEYKWKVITRFFKTPELTAKYNTGNPDTCWRNCGSEIGTHTHIFWSCPNIQTFWDDIFTAIGTVFKRTFIKEPHLPILGVIPVGFEGENRKYLLRILFTAALKCITIMWLKAESPTYVLWVEKVKEIYRMEEITFSLRVQRELFIERWSPVKPLLSRSDA